MQKNRFSHDAAHMLLVQELCHRLLATFSDCVCFSFFCEEGRLIETVGVILCDIV